MSWIAIVFWMIRNLPELLSLIQKIIHGGASDVAKAAIIAAIKSGNKQAVTDAISKHCDGSVIGCAPDLK